MARNNIFNMMKNVPRRNAIQNGGGRPETGSISTNQPLGYEDWLGNQPYGGNISPFEPQGTDYWQDEYADYLGGWESKFGGETGPGRGTPSNPLKQPTYTGNAGIVQSQTEAGGTQQYGPGWQSGIQGWMDSVGNFPGTTYGFGPNSWDSLQDAYDAWELLQGNENYENVWGGVSSYDNFYDWWTGGSGNADFQGGSMGASSTWQDQSGLGGGPAGNQGGAGDLGTGSYFAGGGMNSSLFTDWSGSDTAIGGLWEQNYADPAAGGFGVAPGMGPTYNSQGECIACCDS